MCLTAHIQAAHVLSDGNEGNICWIYHENESRQGKSKIDASGKAQPGVDSLYVLCCFLRGRHVCSTTKTSYFFHLTPP